MLPWTQCLVRLRARGLELEAAGPQTVLAKVGGVWASYAGDAEADDLPLEVAFRAAMARSRKGGMSSLQPAERRIVESCKVLMWGYVAEPRFLSTRALKNNAEVDVMAAEGWRYRQASFHRLRPYHPPDWRYLHAQRRSRR